MSTQRIGDDGIIPANNSNATSRLSDNSSAGSTSRISDTTIVGSGAGLPDADQGIISSGNVAPTHLAPGVQINLNGHDFTIAKLITSSGEAEIYLVQGDKEQVVLKYYFSNYKPKDEIITKLHALKRKDIMSPLDSGIYQDRFFELSEYMTGGTMDALMPLKDFGKIKKYAGLIAEALNACHQNGIIHRDIKPVNIFFRTAAKDEIVLGDFGISSALQAGADYRFTTSVNRTTAYAAPELFTNINNQTTLDKKVDYYALGISLLELWLGHDPFRDFAEFMAMRIKIEGRVIIPADMDSQLQTLIKGLITTEPPKRWGYEEVNKWLRGEAVEVHQTSNRAKFKPYEWDDLKNVVIDEPKELAELMDNDRKKATRQLYSRAIPDWVKNNSQDMYSELLYIVEKEFPNNTAENAAAGVTKAIYTLDRERSFKGYDGTVCNSIKDIARHVEAKFNYYREHLKNPRTDLYLFFETRGFEDRVSKYQKYFMLYVPERALNLIILDLDDNNLVLDNTVYDNVQQLVDSNRDLVKEVVNPDSKISLWLDLTYRHLMTRINTWRGDAKNQNIETLRYVLNISGFRLNGQEAADVKSFITLLQSNIGQFTTAADAQKNSNNANYWLNNYQSTSLAAVFGQLLAGGNLSKDNFMGIYSAAMALPDTKPFQLATQAAGLIRQVPGIDAENKKALANITKNAFKQYLDNNRSVAVYALDNLEKMLRAIQGIQTADHQFAEFLLMALNVKIRNDIHSDLDKIKDNSDSFALYYARLIEFFKQVQAILPTLPVLIDFKRKQDQIDLSKQQIESKYNTQKASEEHKINMAYATLQADQEKLQIDYKPYFKSYAIILWGTMSVIQIYFVILTYLLSNIWSGFELSLFIAGMPISAAFYVFIGYWVIGKIKLSVPFAKLLVRPLVPIRGSQLYVEIDKLRSAIEPEKAGKIDMLNTRVNGRINDELFSESIRIMLTDQTDGTPVTAVQ
ncbi:protein kinase domain-containing protein [Mucilaginibacter paludis]|uniref:Serine/threonine protein kinase n=1 Tax=Mucilaginibacter paludis DSM 18603 TaxID=714943 RepID=H1Y6U8_9SPHI|nr:protein kinase [Mucilaginibacter paludis]EHQ28355.1 serine/threonine protein kinase [Mucilaginibacter paludis DSM 18603]